MSQKKYRYTIPSTGEVFQVWIEKGKYSNGRTALTLVDEEGQVSCATVNLPGEKLSPGDIHVKTWGENENMLDFLVKNSIVRDCGLDVPTGFVNARVCTLLI